MNDVQLWLTGDWPRETATHLPLARAVLSIAKELAGEAWTGREAQDFATYIGRPLLPAPGLEYGASWQTVCQAATLIGYPKPRSGYSPGLKLSVEHWSKARSLLEQQYGSYLAGHDRVVAGCAEMVRACTFGEIETFYREDGRIEMQRMPADAWAVVRSQVFLRCRVFPWDWQTSKADGQLFCSVFVSRESFDRYQASRFAAPASGSEDEAAADIGGSEWWQGSLKDIRAEATCHFTLDRSLTRERLHELLKAKWPLITLNFVRNRVWAESRLAAGLDAAGTAGKRKTKSVA